MIHQRVLVCCNKAIGPSVSIIHTQWPCGLESLEKNLVIFQGPGNSLKTEYDLESFGIDAKGP